MKKILLPLCITISATYALGYSQIDLDKFSNTNLCSGCDLSNAQLAGNHSHAVLAKANLSNSSGYYINLSEADLSNANMTQSSFVNANFSGANFVGAVLFKANFSSTNLYQANITTQQISQLESVCKAIMPDGSTGQCKQKI